MGTENGLMLLDRSGQGKVYNLINRRRFQQMDVLEGLNVLVTISGLWTNSRQLTSNLQLVSAEAALTHHFYPFIFSSSLTGKKNKLRVYYLSWLRNRILHNDPEVEKKQGWITVGELEGCMHYKVGRKTLYLFMGTNVSDYFWKTISRRISVSLFSSCSEVRED